MQKHPTIEETRTWAAALHAQQTDKAGKPYIDHLDRVYHRLKCQFLGASEDEFHAAYLHDCMEDQGVTAATMRNRGYSERTIALVRAVSRLPEDKLKLSYAQWIDRLATSGDRGAIRLKLVDNEDNLDPARLAVLPRNQQDSLKQRYRSSVRRLKRALRELDRTLPPEQLDRGNRPDEPHSALSTVTLIKGASMMPPPR